MYRTKSHSLSMNQRAHNTKEGRCCRTSGSLRQQFTHSSGQIQYSYSISCDDQSTSRHCTTCTGPCENWYTLTNANPKHTGESGATAQTELVVAAVCCQLRSRNNGKIVGDASPCRAATISDAAQ